MILPLRPSIPLPADLLDQVLFNMPCGLCIAQLDEKATLLFANDCFYRLFGYENAEQAQTDAFFGLLDRANECCRMNAVQKIRSLRSGDEEMEHLEIRLQNRANEEFWMMAHIRRTSDENPLMICACMDITAQKRTEEELRFREEEYRIAARQSDKLVFRYDITHQTAYLSPELTELCDEPVIVDLISRVENAKIISPGSIDAFHDLCAAVQSGVVQTGGAILQMRLVARPGPFSWYRVAYSLIYREDQTPAQAVLSLENVSEQHEREIAYNRWEQTYAAMSKDKTAYIEFDLTQNRLEQQKGSLIDRFPPLAEPTMEAAMLYFIENWVHPDDRETFRNSAARDHLLSSYFRGVTPEKIDYRHRKEDGHYEWVRFSVQMLPDPYSANIRASFLLRDIDARKREELQMLDRLRTDPLTGALNRNTFIAQAEAIFSSDAPGARHALAILDIDHFKEVNDCFGHGFGDRILIRVSETLRSALRADDLVGRLGGDEFLVLLRNVPKREMLESKLENLREMLFQRISETKSVSCSIGAATFPIDGTAFDTLYRNTDIALYAAKAAGRNCVRLFSEDLNPPITLFDANQPRSGEVADSSQNGSLEHRKRTAL